MGRKHKIWVDPGTAGCGICGSKNKGGLASPGFLSGMLCCESCLVVGDKIDVSPRRLRELESLGWLDHSRKAFRANGLVVFA